jgi:hypothetical protein
MATYNIRSPKQDSEKKIVLCKKGDDITQLDGMQLTYLLKLQSTVWESFNFLTTTTIIPTETTLLKIVLQNAESFQHICPQKITFL